MVVSTFDHACHEAQDKATRWGCPCYVYGTTRDGFRLERVARPVTGSQPGPVYVASPSIARTQEQESRS